MNEYWILVLLAVLFGVATPSSSQEKPMRNRQANPHSSARSLSDSVKSVVSLVVYDKSGKASGQGSGFFVTRGGKLVTNLHVIEGAASVVAKSANGAFYSVKGVLASDKEHDLAILKVAGNDFVPLSLGDSDSVQLGDKVVAIGSPLGLEQTVSEGLISAIRDLDGSSVFQTTAPVSPGSSGGVLVNSKNEVIGVTTFQLNLGQNLNFAVPAKYISPLLKSENIAPFAPKEQATTEELKMQPRTADVPVGLPRYWTNLVDGSTVDVRVDGDFRYEQSSSAGDGRYLEKADYICETKRQGDQWVGKCRFRLLLVWASLVSPHWCNLELDEVITSLTRSRIEGESQKPMPAPSMQDCPSPGNGRVQFALIPKY